MSIQKFSPKDPSETILISFDFINLLTDATETLVSNTWTAIVEKGIDPNPSAILTGIPFIGYNYTTGFVTGGLDGVTYNITVIVTTTKGQTLKLSGNIKVEEQK